MTAKTKSVQRWERAEVERSSMEAALTPDDGLRVTAATFARYAHPPRDTAYPLEYAYYLLGDIAGLRVVDFGCGSGANTALLTDRGASVCAFDISRDLLELAERRLALSGRAGEARFIAASAHQLPFPDSSVDVIFGSSILHHLDLDLTSQEIRRVLKPEGRAIFKEPFRNSRLISLLRPLVPYRAPDISPYERPLTDEDLRRFAAGFSRCSVRAFALPHVQLGQIAPVLRHYWRTWYRWDRWLLDRMRSLERYASIRVISLVK